MYCDVTGVGIYLGEIWYGELPSEFKNQSSCICIKKESNFLTFFSINKLPSLVQYKQHIKHVHNKSV
jgi:hypothetical protein